MNTNIISFAALAILGGQIYKVVQTAKGKENSETSPLDWLFLAIALLGFAL